MKVKGKLDIITKQDPKYWTEEDRNLIKQVNELDKNDWK